MPPDTRDEVVDYIDKWTVRAEIAAKQLLAWMGLPTSKFHLWRKHYGSPHAHNSHIPRDGWLDAWEKQAIVDFHRRFPLEGYRRIQSHTFFNATFQVFQLSCILWRARTIACLENVVHFVET